MILTRRRRRDTVTPDLFATLDARRDVACLVAEHTAWARRVARRIARRLPRVVSRDDAEAAGLVGLWRAASKFHGMERVPFRAWAYLKVTGAVQDWARTEARQWKRRQRVADAASELASQRLRDAAAHDRYATDAELVRRAADCLPTQLALAVFLRLAGRSSAESAAALGLSAKAYGEALRDARTMLAGILRRRAEQEGVPC